MNSVEHSGDVFSCMLNIQHALKKHDVYKGNYQGMMQLPMVRKLKKENKRLKEQIRILRGETQKKSNLYKNIPKKEEEEEEEEDDVIIISPPDKVVIKIEPEEVAKKQEPSIVVPNAAVVVVVKEDKKETSKVVYELIEKEEEEEDEEEVVEEEEEEVEVVEEEEEVEEEYLEITINGVSYCTCDQENGSIYELTEDGDIGAVKGVYKNGIPHMDVV